MMLDPNPKLTAYHALLREGKEEEAARLYEELRQDLDNALLALIGRLPGHREEVTDARRGVKINYSRAYRELTLDYRTATRIAKECSEMKKILRQVRATSRRRDDGRAEETA